MKAGTTTTKGRGLHGVTSGNASGTSGNASGKAAGPQPTKAPQGVAPTDVTAVAGAIVSRGDTALQKKNADAAQQAGVAHGGGTLSKSPLMARFKRVGGTQDGDSAMAARLEARARRVFTAAELDGGATDVLLPLAALIQEKPDPKRFNEATWSAFQLACGLDEMGREALLQALTKPAAPLPTDLPPGLRAAVSTPGMARETLALLLRARALVGGVMDAELPSLTPDDAAALMRVVHDAGYGKEQLERIASPGSILCGATPDPHGALLDEARLSLLSPAQRRRFSLQERARHAGTEGSMPRLTLADLVAGPRGSDGAVAFLTLSGKDVHAPCAELGGGSMASFIQRRAGESPDAFQQRLASKQVLNPFAQGFDALVADAERLGAAGGDATAQLGFLRKKQEMALGPALLLVSTPALFSRANDPSMSRQTLEGLMQVAWRVGNPQLSFRDPLISSGIEELRASHREQLGKDATLGHVVIHAEKTRALSGLRDDTYGERLKQLLTDRGIPVKSNLVAQSLSRLVRDAGADNLVLQRMLARIDMNGPEQDVIAQLHALRAEPSLFGIQADPRTPAQVAGLAFSWSGDRKPVLPEFVSATTVGYRVTLREPMGAFAAGESVVLRVPKGAHLVSEDGAHFSLQPFDKARLAETSARMGDAEVMEQRVRLTQRVLVTDGDGNHLLLEKRASHTSAGELVNRGRPLTLADARSLADQYIRGLCDVDAKTRPHGVFFELGPDNYLMDDKGIVGSYVDVALLFRSERERAEFGFFQGGYSSAANWIIGDNTPLTPDRVRALWRGDGLDAGQRARRDLFARVLQERLQPDHPVYVGVPSAVRDATIASLQRDARFLVPTGEPYSDVAGVLGKQDLAALSKKNVARLRGALGPLSPAEQALVARLTPMPLTFAHRLDAAKLDRVLDHGAVGTLKSLSPSQGAGFTSKTPPSEIALFHADRYVFGFVGFVTPSHKYGDILVDLKDETWRARAWAGTKTGYEHFMVAEQQGLSRKLTEEELSYDRYDRPGPELLQGARASLASDAFVPADFSEACALGVVDLLRRRELDPATLTTLPDDALLQQLGAHMMDEYIHKKHKAGFLEARILDDVALRDIRRVEIPQTAENASLIGRLSARDVPLTHPA